jgi:hypothetical protein
MSETVLELRAVEAMLDNTKIQLLMSSYQPARVAKRIMERTTNPPDFLVACANCTDGNPLAIAIHTYLMDWRPE